MNFLAYFVMFVGMVCLGRFVASLGVIVFDKAEKIVKLWRVTRKLKKQMQEREERK